jgi:1-acyl-sn-glycerol-3-phosphate acyltransferase
MLRLLFVIPVLAGLTFVLIPAQAVALIFNLASRRTIPVFYHRKVCALLGIRVHVKGAPMHDHPLLVVANHSSWLDIPIITSILSVVFVAKSEVASWPLVGLLAKLQRSVFVERNRRHKTGETNARIARSLAEGDAVVLFGEGTSSDGNRVLPFRSALVGAAREALASLEGRRPLFIQPLSIAYVGLHGLPLGRQHRPVAAWFGEMALFPHLMNVIRRGALDVVVTWGEPIAYAADIDRKAIAQSLQQTVRRLTAQALREGPLPVARPALTGDVRGKAAEEGQDGEARALTTT